jgi:hypothetical protein
VDGGQRRVHYTPRYTSRLNRIEPQFKDMRYFCLARTGHPDQEIQARRVADYIDRRNRHRDNPELRHLRRRQLGRQQALPANTANVA